MTASSSRCADYDNVVQIGLGKSGTTTVQLFFTQHLSYNQSCANLDQLRRSLAASGGQLPMTETLAACPHFYISELARVYFPRDNDQYQLSHMGAIRRQLGDRTLFVHCQRSTPNWLRSVRGWNSLQERFTQRDMDGLPPGRGRTPAELAEWYNGVNAYLQFAFRWRPNYVRVNVDVNGSLEETLLPLCRQPPGSYRFGHANANTKLHGASASTLEHGPQRDNFS